MAGRTRTVLDETQVKSKKKGTRKGATSQQKQTCSRRHITLIGAEEVAIPPIFTLPEEIMLEIFRQHECIVSSSRNTETNRYDFRRVSKHFGRIGFELLRNRARCGTLPTKVVYDLTEKSLACVKAVANNPELAELVDTIECYGYSFHEDPSIGTKEMRAKRAECLTEKWCTQAAKVSDRINCLADALNELPRVKTIILAHKSGPAVFTNLAGRDNFHRAKPTYSPTSTWQALIELVSALPQERHFDTLRLLNMKADLSDCRPQGLHQLHSFLRQRITKLQFAFDKNYFNVSDSPAIVGHKKEHRLWREFLGHATAGVRDLSFTGTADPDLILYQRSPLAMILAATWPRVRSIHFDDLVFAKKNITKFFSAHQSQLESLRIEDCSLGKDVAGELQLASADEWLRAASEWLVELGSRLYTMRGECRLQESYIYFSEIVWTQLRYNQRQALKSMHDEHKFKLCIDLGNGLKRLEYAEGVQD